jgi:hypothetical protein
LGTLKSKCIKKWEIDSLKTINSGRSIDRLIEAYEKNLIGRSD